MKNLVGRKQEIEILTSALKSNRSELVVVYGRRRIGKTFLIREVYKDHIKFEFSGIHHAGYKSQLKNFNLTLADKYPKTVEAHDWIEAFHQLGKYINQLRSTTKKVIFIDEFPWLDTRKSGFLGAFDNFWNSYASKRKDLVVVICGSAASYIIQHIIKNKGGLHNRLTHSIQLQPFNLFETEQLLKRNKVKLSRYEILQVYMVMGGVPHYLEKILPGESVPQLIDRLCFKKNGFLRSEFDHVFASLFEQYDNHEAIIRALATVRKGLTRTSILHKTHIHSGGTLSKTLEELEDSGFIEKYMPYKGVKDALYRLTDEYSMFYIKFVERIKPSARSVWMKMQGQPSYKIWSGFCFETVCLKHVEQIKECLKIGGVHSIHGSWIEKNEQQGAQIDLLIDRDDNIINVCEMKFYNSEFKLDKKYAADLSKKLNAFQLATKTKKTIFTTFITSYGLSVNQYSRQWVQNEVRIEDLFIDL
jgi:AAA+ ATPase superfamily predicted ATPase